MKARWRAMIGVLFEIKGGSREQYLRIIDGLKARGALETVERKCHAAGPMEGGWRVVDVWESREAYEQYAREHLAELMRQVEMPEPTISIWEVEQVIA